MKQKKERGLLSLSSSSLFRLCSSDPPIDRYSLIVFLFAGVNLLSFSRFLLIYWFIIQSVYRRFFNFLFAFILQCRVSFLVLTDYNSCHIDLLFYRFQFFDGSLISSSHLLCQGGFFIGFWLKLTQNFQIFLIFGCLFHSMPLIPMCLWVFRFAFLVYAPLIQFNLI